MVRRAAVGAVQVLEEDHLLLETAAAQHAGGLATVADPGGVGWAGADAAQPAEVVQAGRGPSAHQLDGGGGVLPDEALRRNHRCQRGSVLAPEPNYNTFPINTNCFRTLKVGSQLETKNCWRRRRTREGQVIFD